MMEMGLKTLMMMKEINNKKIDVCLLDIGDLIYDNRKWKCKNNLNGQLNVKGKPQIKQASVSDQGDGFEDSDDEEEDKEDDD